MGTFSRHCPTRLSAFLLALLLLSVTVQAGPTVHSAAQPDFRDPLANARPAATAALDSTINPIGNTSPDSVRIPLVSDLGPLGDRVDTGLEQAQTDDIARTVRDEFLGGGPANSATGSDTAGDSPDGSPASILQALVNSVPGGSADTGTGQTGENTNAASSASSIIDATLNNMIITILNPDLTTEGMVTFSIAGFGEFALLLLQESGSMFLVDMDSGKAVKFSEVGDTRVSGRISGNDEGTGRQERAPSNALQRVLEILERNVLPVITSPITLATIVLFGIIWVVWRLSARE